MTLTEKLVELVGKGYVVEFIHGIGVEFSVRLRYDIYWATTQFYSTDEITDDEMVVVLEGLEDMAINEINKNGRRYK